MPKKLQLLLLLLLLYPPDPDHLHLCPLCGCSHEHPYWQRIHRAGVLSGYPGSAEGDLLCSSAHGSRRTLLPVRLGPELALLLNARGLCPPDTSFLVLSLPAVAAQFVPPRLLSCLWDKGCWLRKSGESTFSSFARGCVHALTRTCLLRSVKSDAQVATFYGSKKADILFAISFFGRP